MTTDAELRQGGFSLVEMLVALAVVSLMMIFMFSLAGQAMNTWEIGGRQMESAQSARIGMNLIANELRYAVSTRKLAPAANLATFTTNFVPVVAVAGAASLPNVANANIQATPGSDQLFFVAPIGPHEASQHTPFGEIGYMCAFTKGTGVATMIDKRYFLLRHGSTPGYVDSTTDFRDFFKRGANDTNWITTSGTITPNNRTPLIDNCISLKFQYASNAGLNVQWVDNWTSQSNLPLGILVTVKVLDAKSANRLAAYKGDTPLSATEISNLSSSDPLVDRLLKQGTTVIRRFVPLVNSGTP